MVAAAPIVTGILTSINTVITWGRENQRIHGEIEGSLGVLKREVEMAEWDMAKYESVDENLTVQMQDLLCDIDDFTSNIFIPGKAAAFGNSVLGKDCRLYDSTRIQHFLGSIKNITDRQAKYSKPGNDATNLPSAAAPSTALYAPEKDLDEVFLEAKKEFEELLTPADDGKLRLISIVGCSGSGKTVLARSVYEDTMVQPSRPGIDIHEANHVRPFPSSTEIHEANKTTTEILEDVTASEVNAQPSPPTAPIHKSIAFDCKAWVEASACNDVGDLLHQILKEVYPMAAGDKTPESVKKFLQDKRYLVVIDDLHLQWMDIERVLPKNDKESRVIVTTRVHSIARAYCSGNYYVYPMQCLDEANSECLFWKKVFGSQYRTPSVPEGNRSRNILAKCDGLPLAVTSAGRYVRSKGRNPHLCDDRYKEVCEELHNFVASDEPDFGVIKRRFTQCYQDLTDYDDKMCLLYLSIFPRGHHINSKSFARRLNAEALVAEENAKKCLNNLIDKSMIEPSLTRNSCNIAKRCRVQGMVLEFAIHKSVSRNLVTLVEKGNVRISKSEKKVPQQIKTFNVRRLTVQCTDKRKSNLIPEEINLSTVRSLSIFKSKHLAPEIHKVDFKGCKVMRVLDLEGCKGLHMASGVLDCICELLLLKYLNLKNSDVDKIPTKIENLKHLETLDIRQTSVEILPVEVLMLPELVHLFGEFLLPALAGRGREILVTTFLKDRSKLQTLVGIVINETKDFEVVIRHARKLKKVKICGKRHSTAPAASAPIRGTRRKFRFGDYFCLSGGPERENTHCPNPNLEPGVHTVRVLVSSLEERFTDLESISIVSSGISEAFLACNLTASIVSSIKLRGSLTSLPAHTFKNLRNLKTMHLFSTGLSSKILVEALQSLECLEYLKLGEEDGQESWEMDFSVQKDGFPALLELCFEGAKSYPRMMIRHGAMSLLVSLQLLCPHPTAFEHPLRRVEGIEHLKNLGEVILHHTADDATLKAWEKVAMEHTNMPCVKKQPEPAQPAINNAV